jgi:hypothetical protein
MRGALCAAAISLAVGVVARSHAQDTGTPAAVIAWSATRKLAVNDFKGRSPGRATEASLSWVAIEASWECADGKGSSLARAVFDPARSWWREPGGNLWQSVDDASPLAPRDDNGRSLLEHEQLHFDLTELWARRIREKFEGLPGVCRTPGSAPAFEKAIADLERDWQKEQKQYDKETAHGLNVLTQRTWERRAQKALKETHPPAVR